VLTCENERQGSVFPVTLGCYYSNISTSPVQMYGERNVMKIGMVGGDVGNSITEHYNAKMWDEIQRIWCSFGEKTQQITCLFCVRWLLVNMSQEHNIFNFKASS